MRPGAPEVERYARRVAERLEASLEATRDTGHGEPRGDLCAVYVQGSAALGGYMDGPSDIDMIAICAGALSPERKQAVVEALRHEALPCPASGLELVLYSRRAVEHPESWPVTSPGRPARTRPGVHEPGRCPDFELNLNTGPRRPFHVAYGPGQDAPHWFVIDLAVTRDRGVPVVGPPARDLIAPVPRPWILAALRESLDWHDDHDAASPNRVLNACRAWRYAVTGDFGTKAEGAAWAREHSPHGELIDDALALRRDSRFTDLDPTRAAELLSQVRAALEQAASRP